MSDFERWFADQDFYTNMRFIHGDGLFAKDGDVYRVLPVQMTYQAWQTARYKTKDERIALTQEWHTKGWKARQEEIDQLKVENTRLSGLLKEQKRCFDECSQMVSDLIKERDQLKAEKVGLEKLIKDWRKSANWMCTTDDKHVINSLRSCADDLEKALRGGHE